VRSPLNAIDRWFARANGGDASIHLELTLGGRLDHGRLRRATARAVADHPLATARLAGDAWVAPGPPVNLMGESEAGLPRARLEQINAPFELSAGRGVRVVHVEGAQDDRLLFVAHHALVDGAGLFTFAAGVAAAYSGRPRLAATAAPPRRTPAAGALEDLRALAHSRPATIAPEPDQDVSGSHGVLERRLHFARVDAPTTEDLAASLILAIAAWNEAHDRRDGRLAVLVAVNLRPLAARTDLFANFSLAVPVWLDEAERATTAGATSLVRRRLHHYGSRRVSGAVYDAVGGRSVLPPWFIVLAAQPAVLSHLGRAPDLAFAGIPVVDCWGTPSTPPPLGLSIATVLTPSGLHVGVRNRRAVLGDDAAARLTDQWLAGLDVIRGTPTA